MSDFEKRQLEPMLPMEKQIEQLQRELSHAQAACMEARLLLGPDYPGSNNQDWEGWHKRRHDFLKISKQDGWLSPDEAQQFKDTIRTLHGTIADLRNESKRLEAELSEVRRNNISLLEKMERYEKALRYISDPLNAHKSMSIVAREALK